MESEPERVHQQRLVLGPQLQQHGQRALLVLGRAVLDETHELLDERRRPDLAAAGGVGGEQEEDGQRLVHHVERLVVDDLEKRRHDAGLGGPHLVLLVEHQVEDGRGGVLLPPDAAVLEELDERRDAAQPPDGELVLVDHGQAEQRRGGVLLRLRAAVAEDLDDERECSPLGDVALVALVDGQVQQRRDRVLLHLLVRAGEEPDERRDAAAVGDERPVLRALLGQHPDPLHSLPLHVEVDRRHAFHQRRDVLGAALMLVVLLRHGLRLPLLQLHLVLVAPFQDQVLERVVGRQRHVRQPLPRLRARPLPAVQPFLDAPPLNFGIPVQWQR
ncbi:Os08g0481300 [Oryza sativa Japonica Group]|uniref:Os08g0481300 protein n=1 Tax=Oryza sativa subsp. japonica TaxID=39947 RepID=A0A0P0XHE8_ORYSJ|nr:hypothetical protein EE612_044947 [Oryza sativa]BAT05927.1 Os08g0481300 [Oryza sativa Japonica Group]